MIRYFSIAVALTLSIMVQGQFFKPFDLTSKKLFAEPYAVTLSYNMAFDSAAVGGTDSLFHHYKALNDTSTYMNWDCATYSDQYCYREELPRWDGTLFKTDNSGNYWLRTLNDDTLHFNFNISIGGGSVIYEDSIQKFSIERQVSDTSTILGYLDSISVYTILHTDLLDQPITSPLNDWQVVIGKEIGLINFFQIDSFPAVLRPLILAGNKEPDLGIHQITPATIYDFAVGDVIQRQYYSGYSIASPPFIYYKLTILSRSESPETVSYQMMQETFGPTTADYGSDTIGESWSKQTVLATIPFDKFDGTMKTLFRDMTFCGLPIWQLYELSSLFMSPCEFDDCWQHIGAPGPGIASHSNQYIGIGNKSFSQWQEFNGPFHITQWDITYFKKNGIECGQEIHLGIRDDETVPHLEVFPNPASESVTVHCDSGIQSIQVTNSLGQVIRMLHPISDRITLDLSMMNTGQYFIQLQTSEGHLICRPLMLIR